MTTVTIKGYVHSELSRDKTPVYSILSYDATPYGTQSLVLEQDFEVTLPEDFNAIELELKQLRASKAKLEKRTAEALDDLQQKINDLLMLGYTA